MSMNGRVFERTLNGFERLLVLVTGGTLVTTLLYIAGNYQSFTDSTQQLLLTGAQYLAGTTVVSLSLAVVLEIVFVATHRRWARLRRVAFMIVLTVVTGSILAGVTTIIVIQKPL